MALLSNAGWAQQTSSEPDQAEGAPAAVQEVIVTGSRIRQPNLESTSPMSTIGNEEFQFSGTTRVEDLLNTAPQIAANQSSGLSNGATGTAMVDLRHLGPTRTLVLVDGKRLGPGSPRAGGEAADLNQIPVELVKRVEILTGGASAVYGSDAIAGVVNFIIDTEFEGLRLNAQYGFYQHNNDDDAAQAANNARGFQLPQSNITAGLMRSASAVLGFQLPNGGITMYAGIREVDAITEDKYDYSNCAFSFNASGTPLCLGSSTTSPARFGVNGGAGPSYTLDAQTGNTFRPFSAATDTFNFAPDNFFQRPDTRYSFGAFAHYDITDEVEFYSTLMFTDDRTRAQLGPSGIFYGTAMRVNCNNPHLSAQQVAGMCTAFGLGVNDTASILVGKRSVESGGVVDDLRHTSFNIVTGLRGAIFDGWEYDVYGQYYTVGLDEEFQNDFSILKSQRALLAVRDANGNIVCQSVIDGTDPACVPYNIFSVGGVTPAALGYLNTSGFQRGRTTQRVISGSITNNLGQYGFASPLARSGVGVAVGAEYRRDALDFRVDQQYASGDLAFTGASGPVAGEGDVTEVFAELHVPLIQDLAFAKEVSVDLGYRSSSYSAAGDAQTYKILGTWAPIEDFRLRAGFNHAVRAPNLVELFLPQTLAGNLQNDPCAGAAPTATLEQCLRTGLAAAQYGNVPGNPAGNYNSIQGGNPDLKPEEADTITIGAVIAPSAVPNLSFTVDYFSFKVDEAISGVGGAVVLSKCLNTGDPAFCNLVHRSPTLGSLWFRDGYVIDTNQNTGGFRTSGFDISANYRLDWASLGTLRFSLAATHQNDFKVRPAQGDAFYDCSGYYGSTCGTPQPTWRSRTRATWESPWGPQLSLQWRYMNSVELDRLSSDPALAGVSPSPALNELGSRSYFDLSTSADIGSRLLLTAGINNLLDKQPPLATTQVSSVSVQNGNTFPQVYDALGRFLFVNLSAKF